MSRDRISFITKARNLTQASARIIAGGALTASLLLVYACGAPKNNDADLTDLGINPPYQPNHRSQDQVGGEKNFAALINNFREGTPAKTPWMGSFWPYSDNGIATGKVSGSDGHGSPAGKYDAARGCKTSAQEWEVGHHGSKVPGVEGWWGHCNGWSAAAALYQEPTKTTTVNGINFSMGEQKALLTEASMMASADFFGDRFGPGDTQDGLKFRDTLPNQFFLVLTNYMGKRKQGVLIDADSGIQVWNQPLAGYRFDYPKKEDYLGAHPSAPNIHRIMVTFHVWWANDSGVPVDQPTDPFDYTPYTTTSFTYKTYRGEIWLDGPVVFGADGKIASSGNIVIVRNGNDLMGGEWSAAEGSAYDHPDYTWVPYSLLNPADPTQNPADSSDPGYVNPNIDLRWLEAHMVPGVDDTSARPCNVPSAPPVQPSGRPSTRPSTTPEPLPIPVPSRNPLPIPQPQPSPIRLPLPQPQPQPLPQPQPSTRP